MRTLNNTQTLKIENVVAKLLAKKIEKITNEIDFKDNTLIINKNFVKKAEEIKIELTDKTIFSFENDNQDKKITIAAIEEVANYIFNNDFDYQELLVLVKEEEFLTEEEIKEEITFEEAKEIIKEEVFYRVYNTTNECEIRNLNYKTKKQVLKIIEEIINGYDENDEYTLTKDSCECYVEMCLNSIYEEVNELKKELCKNWFDFKVEYNSNFLSVYKNERNDFYRLVLINNKNEKEIVDIEITKEIEEEFNLIDNNNAYHLKTLIEKYFENEEEEEEEEVNSKN